MWAGKDTTEITIIINTRKVTYAWKFLMFNLLSQHAALKFFEGKKILTSFLVSLKQGVYMVICMEKINSVWERF